MAKEFGLSPVGEVVWEDRYAKKDEQGKRVEKDITETFKRVAKAIASKEKDKEEWEEKFYDIMVKGFFCPAGRVLAHAGTHYSQLLNCFVLPFKKDSLEEIMSTATNMAITQKFGGGTGHSYSKLRPSGCFIKGVNGRSCGTLGFIGMMSTISEVIEQGGCLTGDTLINTNEGLLYYNELIKEKEQGWYPQDLSLKTKDGDYRSKQFYVNGYSDIISLETDSGLKIKGTLQHKIFTFSDKGYEWKEFRYLKKNDYLVSRLGAIGESSIQLLDTAIQKDHHNCVIPERLPDKINEGFAYFLGYYIGNGFVGSREDDYRVGVSIPEKSYLIPKIEGIFQKHFGSNINVLDIQKPEDKSKTFYVSNKIVKKFLSVNGLLKLKSNVASIPEKIRRSPKNILGSFLAGLFEADGSVTHGYPELSTSSYVLAKEVQVLLFGLGIPCKLYKGTNSEKRFSKKDHFYVKVVSYIGLKTWNEVTPKIAESRFKVCREHNPDLDREKNYILPFAEYWLKEAHSTLLLRNKTERSPELGKLVKSIKRYLRGDRGLTVSAFFRFYRDPLLKGLVPSLENNFFSRITAIYYSEDCTFDMEVPETSSYIANSIISHNSRRGANMGALEVWHPDIWEFISFKNDHNWERLREFVDVKDEEKWRYFKYENLYKWQMYNVSVAISDGFLDALDKDEVWPFIWEGNEWELYKVVFKEDINGVFNEKEFEVTADCDVTALWKVKRKIPYPKGTDKFEVISRRKVKASEIWDRICYNAWADGCPGIINLSEMRKMHNLEYTGTIEATNPCGEQPLPANSVCNLSSIILSRFVDKEKKVIKDKLLKKAVHDAVRFSDDVIDNCDFPLPEVKEKALNERRIGLGTMGVHDMLIELKLGYDTEEGREFVDAVLRFIRDESYRASIELAKEKGPFPAFNKNKFMKSGFIRTLPKDIRDDIEKHGIRNGTLLSQAPTGSIGALLNVSSGCEPWPFLSFTRNTRLGSYEDGCSAYIEWKKEHSDELKPDYFKEAQEILPEDHVKMMAIFTKYVDSAVSKTINLPNESTVEDVRDAFMLALKSKVKGLTVFRDGCKEGVLIDRKDKKKEIIKEAQKVIHDLQDMKEEVLESRMSPKKRGGKTIGHTSRVQMQKHNLYITVNRNADGELVEVFATVGENKNQNAHHTSGVEDSWAEGLAKMISLALRAGVDTESIIRNLKNIPSDKPVYTTLGDNEASELIPSPPHAIARAIEEEMWNPIIPGVKKKRNYNNPTCVNCGKDNTKAKSPTCYTCLDCGYEACS